MKKIISLLLGVIMCLSLAACGNGKEKATNEELAQAVNLIKRAEEMIITASSYQIDYWPSTASYREVYFVDSRYIEAESSNLADETSKLIYVQRQNAKKTLNNAKTLMGTNGSSDYYVAVKEYYKTVSLFLDLISEFPQGQDRATYAGKVSDYKANCQNAYAETGFYN